MRLSVLDQSPISRGKTATDALGETLALARAADRWGFTRYWCAEHHNTNCFASASPEVLIAKIAEETSHIRVGSGGVLLSHYSPLKVAEVFRMLEALYPGRVDLGIGRAPGSDQLTSRILQYGPGALGGEHFSSQVHALLGFLTGGFAPDHPFAPTTAVPRVDGVPPVWLLGSSDQSAALAAHLGCAFSGAHFINADGGAEVMRTYHRDFKPSAIWTKPTGSIGVFVICADTEERALALGATRDLWRLRLSQGRHDPIPTVAEAAAYEYTAEEAAEVARNRHRHIVGTPEQVKTRLDAVSDAYGVDEFVVISICPDFEDRLRSYELLAEVYELQRPVSDQAGTGTGAVLKAAASR
ncbi:MAG: LLM class flavin-dependent oxidoreductase [Alphaproteobacteria bacterium]